MIHRSVPRWNKFDHLIYKKWQENEISSRFKRLIFGISGGIDSVVLLDSLVRLQSALKVNLLPVYVHHGGNSQYRLRAQVFCQQFCEERRLELIVKTWTGKTLNSEKELREARIQLLRQALNEYTADAVVLAHHRDDLLETRLMRLMRGVGSAGLKAMKVWNGTMLRPMLNIAKQEIIETARTRSLDWIEDPSNQNQKRLRNWVRHTLLPTIGNKNPAFLEKLSQSLDHLASVENEAVLLPIDNNRIDRYQYAHLSKPHKRLAVTKLVQGQQFPQLRSSQLEEICKYLDKTEIEHRFTVGGAVWAVNAEQFWIQTRLKLKTTLKGFE